MRTISEHLEELSFNTMVNEDFVSPHLRKLVKQLRDSGKTFNRELNGWQIRWDRIDSSILKEYPVTNDIDKIIRKNKPCFVFGIQGGLFRFYIDPEFRYRDFSTDKKWDGYHDMNQSQIFDMCKKCDTILILDYNKAQEDAGAVELRRERFDSQKGMWMRHKGDFNSSYGGSYEDWCKILAASNIERYKKLIAQEHAMKDNEFEDVSKRVNDLLQRALAVSVDLSKGKESLEGKSYEVGNMLNYFYGETHWDDRNKRTAGRKGLLTLMAEYLKDKDQLRAGKAWDVTMTEKHAKGTMDVIWRTCDAVEAKIKELEK